MASGKLLRQLIRSGVSGDVDDFKEVSEAVIREERQKQHNLLANDLERILYGTTASHRSLRLVRELPQDTERNLPLVEVRRPLRSREELILSKANTTLLDRVLLEHHRGELLRSHGMRPVERLLFCGPPGCGKTLTSEVLAYELDLPFCVVRLDSVVSSFLGETSANLRKVIDFIQSEAMVVLFDEFDALGKERSDSSEHGELKRVVNTFLQMLDGYSGPSIIIAATNHDQMLDSAIWRRFEEIVVFSKPNLTEIKSLLKIKLQGVRRDFEIKDIHARFKNLSHADIERILRRAIKNMILGGEEFLSENHIDQSIKSEKARKDRLRKASISK